MLVPFIMGLFHGCSMRQLKILCGKERERPRLLGLLCRTNTTTVKPILKVKHFFHVFLILHVALQLSKRKGNQFMKKLKLKITICDDIITIKSGRETELFQGYTVEEAVKLFMERF